jgi:hypothetical protein
MRTAPSDPNRAARAPRLLLAEYAGGANPPAPLSGRDPASVAIALTLDRRPDIRPATEFVPTDAWPHWGIND